MYSNKPNLYIVGVQKCGTTSFYNWLANNDNIVTGYNLKDKHVLFEDNARSIFKNRFKGVGKYYLDASVNYFFFHKKFLRLTDHTEKVLLFLRNPIDRVLSAYNYNYMNGRENRSLREALDYKWSNNQASYELNYFNSNFTYVEHGLYYQGMKDIRQAFSENFKVFLLEEIIRNEEKFIREISSFLGLNLDPNIRKDNKSKSVRSYYLSKFLSNNNSVKSFLKTILNEKKLKKIAKKAKRLNYNTNQKKVDKIDNDLHNKLLLFYKSDIKKTSDFLGKDLMNIWF